jgi:SOS-response transcriptional repressor LexA
MADAWLNVDTYGLPSVAEQMRALNGVTAADVQKAAARLLRDSAYASVVVGNSDIVKAQMERYGKVEIMGEIKAVPEPKLETNTKKPDLTKPQIKSPAKPE